jgi:hypothetical protein
MAQFPLFAYQWGTSENDQQFSEVQAYIPLQTSRQVVILKDTDLFGDFSFCSLIGFSTAKMASAQTSQALVHSYVKVEFHCAPYHQYNNRR